MEHNLLLLFLSGFFYDVEKNIAAFWGLHGWTGPTYLSSERIMLFCFSFFFVLDTHE